MKLRTEYVKQLRETGPHIEIGTFPVHQESINQESVEKDENRFQMEK